MFCPFCSNHFILRQKAHLATVLLRELTEWSSADFAEFNRTTTLVRSCERNLELLVELASDINAAIVLDKQNKTPDSHKDSFLWLNKLGFISENLCDKLLDSVKLRNGLAHEYEFELNNRKFYDSIKNDFIPAYTEYLKKIVNNFK